MGENAVFHLIALVLLLSFSATVSAVEAALFSLNVVRLRHLEAKAGRRGKMVAGLMMKPKRLIITLIISNELVNIVTSSLVGAYFITLLGPRGKWYAIAFMTGLLLVFGEIIPKTVGVTYPKTLALAAAPVMVFVSRLLAGPVWVIRRLTGGLIDLLGGRRENDLVTEDEFRSLVREGRRTGVLDREEEDIIYNILELGDLPLSELMVPRVEMFAVDEDMPLSGVLETPRAKSHSRIPVYRGDPDHITGILHLKDLLAAKARQELDTAAPAGALAQKPYVVPETMRADELLMAFRNRRVHMAVVVDEYGGTAGLVTMEDLLRRLFEDVTRPSASPGGLYEKLGEGIWAVSGRMPLEEFNRLLGTSLSGGEYHTVGGLLLHLFGRLPRRGEVLRWGNFVFRVTAVEERRIVTARVEIIRGSPPA